MSYLEELETQVKGIRNVCRKVAMAIAPLQRDIPEEKRADLVAQLNKLMAASNGEIDEE